MSEIIYILAEIIFVIIGLLVTVGVFVGTSRRFVIHIQHQWWSHILIIVLLSICIRIIFADWHIRDVFRESIGIYLAYVFILAFYFLRLDRKKK
jgi:hypothetical protein